MYFYGTVRIYSRVQCHARCNEANRVTCQILNTVLLPGLLPWFEDQMWLKLIYVQSQIVKIFFIKNQSFSKKRRGLICCASLKFPSFLFHWLLQWFFGLIKKGSGLQKFTKILLQKSRIQWQKVNLVNLMCFISLNASILILSHTQGRYLPQNSKLSVMTTHWIMLQCASCVRFYVQKTLALSYLLEARHWY